LLVEDDSLLADAVARSLTQSAHAVDVARSGEEADAALSAGEYDLVVLDIELPGLDGFEVLKRLRARRSVVPVLIVTVRDALEERITGLDLGADDYLTKPFHLSELEARVRALIRRAHAGASSDLVHGRLRLNMAARRLYCDDQPVELSGRELAVLELLLLRGSRVVTKQQIIEHLYGWEEVSSSNTIEVFIYRLRKKIEPFGVDIRTVRGMGYLIEKPHAA
jgi:two-component system OmpR family response regulator